MKKLLALLFTSIFALLFLTVYLLITEKIIAGNQKIIEGKLQLEEGAKLLAQGKARLADGSRRLSQAKKAYGTINSVPFMGVVNKLPVSSQVFGVANKKIAEGGALVARGRQKLQAGTAQFQNGQLELSRGEQRLSFANKIRITCAVGAIFFTCLSLSLGYYWRGSLRKMLKRK